MNVNDTEIAWAILQENGFQKVQDVLKVRLSTNQHLIILFFQLCFVGHVGACQILPVVKDKL